MKQPLLCQLFKIIGFGQFTQLAECLQLIQADKRRFVVIEPCIHDVQAVKESLRILPEIRFPVGELGSAQGGADGFFIQAFLYLCLKRIAYDFAEAVRILRFGVFGYNSEIRLQRAVRETAVDIDTDPRIEQGLLYRSAGRIEKRVIQNLKGEDVAHVKGIARHDIVGQESLPCGVLISRDRVFLFDDFSCSNGF